MELKVGGTVIFVWIVLMSQFTIVPLYAQVSSLTKTGTTRAVVVGVSEYKSPEIPSLQFAHKDAMIFVEFLKSPGGGNLKDNQIKLLTNRSATAANFERELQWLYDVSSPGDRAIIFFSGHGDVEQKLGNEGFLLCHDAAPRLYQSTGGFMVYSFKRILQTLIHDKKVDVILILDACRAGTLSGSAIGGPQITTQNLMDFVESKVKIMSCQANEKSIEGKQFGGGRGVFSYYLTAGLAGLADIDGDEIIMVKELRQYLETNVSNATAPIHQHPVIEADAMYPLF